MSLARALALAAALAACAGAANSPQTIALGPDAPIAFTAEHPERPLLGANFRHLDEDAALAAAHEAGLDLIRTDLFWSEVEHQGRFDFSEMDGFLARLQRAHLRPLLILDYFHPDHRGDEISAFARFAKAAAAHFRGRGVIWEIFNEPDVDESDHFLTPPEFARLVREGAAAIHEGDPNARVISGGISFVDLDYTRDLFAAWDDQGAPQITGFGIHPYSHEAPEGAYDNLAALSLSMHEHRAHWPLWATEWGYSAAALPNGGAHKGHTVAARAEQGALAVRSALTLWLSGAEASIWYELRDEGDSAREGDQNFGLLDSQSQPKPAYSMLAAMVHETQGMRLDGPLDHLPDGVHALKFESAEQVMIAVWVAEVRVRASLAIEAGSLLTTDNAVGAPANGHVSLTETDGPLYISWRKPR